MLLVPRDRLALRSLPTVKGMTNFFTENSYMHLSLCVTQKLSYFNLPLTQMKMLHGQVDS